MEKTSQKQNGVTLVSLVITIIVLLIIASIATYSGVNVIRQSQFTAFETELKIMQTEVNDLYDKYTNNTSIEVNGTTYTGNQILNIGKDITEASGQAARVFTAGTSGITDMTGYRYFDTDTIQALKLENVEDEFFVNVAKRSVISCEAVTYEGKNYYTLAQIPNSLYNVEYEDKNTSKPTFNAAYEKIEEGKWQINITNIQYDGYIDKWQVKYQKDGDEYWSTSEDYSFFVSSTGSYKIYIENNSVKSEEITLEVK